MGWCFSTFLSDALFCHDCDYGSLSVFLTEGEENNISGRMWQWWMWSVCCAAGLRVFFLYKYLLYLMTFAVSTKVSCSSVVLYFNGGRSCSRWSLVWVYCVIYLKPNNKCDHKMCFSPHLPDRLLKRWEIMKQIYLLTNILKLIRPNLKVQWAAFDPRVLVCPTQLKRLCCFLLNFSFFFSSFAVLSLTLAFPLPSAAHADHNGLSPRHIKSESDDDDLPNVTLDSVNETGSTALSIARAVQEWVPRAGVWVWGLHWRMSPLTDHWHPVDLKTNKQSETKGHGRVTGSQGRS